MKKYELCILGGGAAAFAAATVANGLECKTAMINSGLPLGGTCVNVGCVPTKHLLEVGNDQYLSTRPRFEAVTASSRMADFQTAIKEKDLLINGLRKRNYGTVLDSLASVTLLEGRGRFVSPSGIEVNGEIIEPDRIIIATGSSPRRISLPGIDQVDVLTNQEALDLKHLPERLIVIGVGPQAMEFAQLFSRLGSQVTVLARGDRILRHEEPEVSQELRRCLEDEGISILTSVEFEGISQEGGTKRIQARIDDQEKTFEAEEILLAAGVVANTKDIELEAAGITITESGDIVVDENLKTSAPQVWAAGDVVGAPQLETVAAKEGHVSALNALTDANKTIDYGAIPHAIFTSPQVASVGMTEEVFSEKHHMCSCRVVEMKYVPKALAVNDTRGLIKMAIHPQTTAIVGVHIVAPLAAEMIHEAVLLVKHGITLDELIDTVHVFPTMSEAIKLVAQSFKRDITTMSCCIE